METILSPSSFCPLFKTHLLPQLQPKSGLKPICCTLKKQSLQSAQQFSYKPTSWFSHVQQGLAALAISLAINFSVPILTDVVLASEFDVLNDGPPKDTYVVDDAGVLSRLTKSDLKKLLSDLESRKGYHINVVTLRKLTVSKVFVCVVSQIYYKPSRKIFIFK